MDNRGVQAVCATVLTVVALIALHFAVPYAGWVLATALLWLLLF